MWQFQQIIIYLSILFAFPESEKKLPLCLRFQQFAIYEQSISFMYGKQSDDVLNDVTNVEQVFYTFVNKELNQMAINWSWIL